MADVTKSLEVIISAKDMTSAVFAGVKAAANAVVSPLDTIADSVFGLQDRVSKYFDQGIFKLAQIGGAYQEQINQLNAYAAAQGKNASSILATIDDIADGTLTAAQRMSVATRTIASGLGSSDIEAVLTYVKRFTEATGQEFDSMAQSVFTAFSSGRYAVLKQMGLFVEEGAAVTDVIAQMRAGLGQFGDAGFNFADAVQAINNDVSDFITYIGAAVNKSEAFQRMTTYATNALDAFVKSFDYDTAAYFFDGLIRSGEIVYSALSEAFGAVYDVVRNTFGRLGTSSGATEFFKALATNALDSGRYFVTFGQYVADAFSTVVWATAKGAEAFGTFYDVVKSAGIGFAASLTEFLTRPIFSVAQSIQELMAASPMLANAWGADTIGAGLSAVQKKIAETNIAFRELQREAMFESNLGTELQALGAEFAEQVAANSSNFAASFEAVAAKIKAGFETFKLPEIEKPKEQDLNAARAAAEAIAKIRAEAERAEAEKEAKKTQDQAVKLIQERTKAETKAEEDEMQDRKRALEARLKDINKIIEDAQAGKGETFKATLGIDFNSLRQEQAAIEAALGKIGDQEAAAKQRAARAALQAFKGAEFDVTNYLNATGNLFKDGKAEIEVKHKEQITEESVLDKLFGRVSWPAALQDLAKAVIAAIVSQMRGERLPMVLTTAA